MKREGKKRQNADLRIRVRGGADEERRQKETERRFKD